MIGSERKVTGGDRGFFTGAVFTGDASSVDEQGLFIQGFKGFGFVGGEGFTKGLEEVIELFETERLQEGGCIRLEGYCVRDKEGLVDLGEGEVPFSTEEGFSCMSASVADLLDGVIRSTAGFLEKGLVIAAGSDLVGVTEGALGEVGFCCQVEEDAIEAFLFGGNRGIAFLEEV